MRNNILDIHEYLATVREELKDFHDREAIVNELHNYIFDLANNISLETGKSVELAFIDTMQQLEDPVSLAENFREENSPSPIINIPIINENTRPLNVPERKLESKQLIIMGVVGVTFVSLILSRISDTFDNFAAVSVWASIIQTVIIIAFIVLVIYYQDEKKFKEQLTSLRKKFEFKELTIEENKLKLRKREPDEKSTMWAALGAHFEGFLGTIFYIFLIIVVFISTFMDGIDGFAVLDIYNENWYYTGFIAIIIVLFVNLGSVLMQMVYGKIREIRITQAISSLISGIAYIVLAIYYPFKFSQLLMENNVDVNFGLSSINSVDHLLTIIFIISAGYQLMMTMYNVFKYATWLPKDQKSLMNN
jgi:hypothetical protein